MTVKNFSFDSTYELDNTFDNDRFIKVRMRIMHDKKNPNYSHFSLESIEKAKPTLSNIPILANVVQNEDGTLDFGGHDITIEEDKMAEGEYRIIFKEIPIGMIPETNNYSIEEFEGRNYVVCDGYIWKEYSNYAQDIVEKNTNTKISMEITCVEYEPLNEDPIYFDILNYKYAGVTMLGQKYGTGMIKANAETISFDLEENKESFIKMAEELKIALENQLAIPADQEETNVEFTEELNEEPTETNEEFTSEEIVSEEEPQKQYSVEEYQNLQAEKDLIQAEFEALKLKVTEFESTISEKDALIIQLNEYKNKNEYEIAKFDIESLIEEFEVALKDSEEFKALKDNINNSFEKDEIFIELDALEKELFAMVGRLKYKLKAEKPKKQNFSRVSIVDDEPSSKVGVYGSAEKYIQK